MALLTHTLALLAMTVATVAIDLEPLAMPLDMAENSFDDQYQNCSPNMTEAFQSLHNFEIQKNPDFAQAWRTAQNEWHKKNSPVAPLASPEQAIALIAYTLPDVCKQFNDAVRVAGRSRQEYRNNFHFKSLHFLLTQALVTLRQSQNGQCHRVFRGVRGIRFQAQHGQRVRFGQFTSTSLEKKVALRFGRDTIFEVHTCHGAKIQNLSRYPWEDEVLIPPFEAFHVTNVTKNGTRTWISLSSNGTYSKYNCEWQ